MIWRVRHQSSVSNCTYESERFDLRLIGAYFVLRRADSTLLETHTYSPSYSTAVMTPVGAWIDVHVFPNARTTVLPNCLDIFAASDWRALGPKAASPTAATFPFPISLSEGCEKKRCLSRCCFVSTFDIYSSWPWSYGLTWFSRFSFSFKLPEVHWNWFETSSLQTIYF